jgi:hypothetical protein
MFSQAKMHFVEQQGFEKMEGAECERRFSALMFQPKAISLLVAIGLVTQYGWYFLALSALLWWNVLLPALNPFDAIYNATITKPRGYPRLGPAPAPRRFSQGMAASFMLGIGVSLLAGTTVLAWILEGFLVVAMLSLLVGRFCLGAYVYQVLTGHLAFANRTLPWGRA